ncbi:peroxidase [Streptomyces cacaoi]|uniref:hypothetical protein n=1 Tax=Streptomyces cacaoi TaxID=1898 RepID=UPI0037498F16
MALTPPAPEDDCLRLRDQLLRDESGRLAEQRHHLDAQDAAFAALAIAHPDRCHTADDYPDWTPPLPVFIPGEYDVDGRYGGVLAAGICEGEVLLVLTGDARAALRATAAWYEEMLEEACPASLTSPVLDLADDPAYVSSGHVTFHRTYDGWDLRSVSPDTPGAVAVTCVYIDGVVSDAALADQGLPVPLTPHREQKIRDRFADGGLTDAELGAHARHDVPSLLAEIDQIRGRTSRSRAMEDALDDTCQELAEQLEAANSQARAAQTRAAELEETLRHLRRGEAA